MSINIKVPNTFSGSIMASVFTVAWLAGIFIAKGFWSVSFAIFIPPYAWYLFVAEIITKYSLL
jgi:hypothetical protein